MRILFFCSDADIGGAERLLAMLGAHWNDSDTLKLVVLMGRGTLSEKLEQSFDEVEYLDFAPSSRDLTGMVRALERQIHQFQPDLISSHLFHADLISALARTRVPKTTTMHTHGLGKNDHPLTRLIARAVGLLSFRFAAVVPSSDSAQMAEFMRALRMRNVRPAILNGADIAATPVFDPTARRFLSIARNHPVKGHRVLFEAFGRIASVHEGWTLHAYGPGVVSEDEAMSSALAEAGASELVSAGRIVLHGPIDDPEEALSGGAALVISSLYGETLPLVGAEAAGAGVPVITTDVGNCPEFADDARFVVEPGSVAELAEALEVFAALSEADRLRLSAAARTRAEKRYHPSRVVAAYREVYADIVSVSLRKR